jgi:Ca2+-binding EF-hand superfamily protein
VFPVSARGDGEIIENSSARADCTEKNSILVTRSTITAAMSPRGPTAAAARHLVDGQIRIDPFAQTYAGALGSPALHGAPFEMVGRTGNRVRGRVFGLTNMEPHRASAAGAAPLPYFVGILSGKVEGGPLEGCELHALYAMSYPAGSNLKKASGGWVMEGAVVCDCQSGKHMSESEPVTTAVPVRQPEANRAAADAALIARFGRAEDLEPALRTLADVDHDGKTTSDEVAVLKMALKAFQKLDTNHDGVLTAEEFAAGASDSLEGMMAALDRDHDGVLSGEELQTLPLPARRHADRNHDGTLDREELLAWLREGRKRQFADFKRNRAGQVSFREYFLGVPTMKIGRKQ